jgi:hypothetical protein
LEKISKRKMKPNAGQVLLNDSSLRRAYHKGRTYCSVTDLVQEVTSEWARRSASSDQYRALSNAIMQGIFAMDVESLRRYKNLQRPTQNLRDYMSDLELVLTSLGETAAVALHRNRGSQGFDDLLADATEAGRIAGTARKAIEQGSSKRPGRHKDRAVGRIV